MWERVVHQEWELDHPLPGRLLHLAGPISVGFISAKVFELIPVKLD